MSKISFKSFHLNETTEDKKDISGIVKYLNQTEDMPGAMEEVYMYMPGLQYQPDGGIAKFEQARHAYVNKTPLPRGFDVDYAPAWFWFDDVKKTTKPIVRFTKDVIEKVGKVLNRGHKLYFIGQTLGGEMSSSATRSSYGYLTGYEIDSAEKYGFDDEGEKYNVNFIVTIPDGGSALGYHIGDDEPQAVFPSYMAKVLFAGVKTEEGYDLYDESGKFDTVPSFKEAIERIKSEIK